MAGEINVIAQLKIKNDAPSPIAASADLYGGLHVVELPEQMAALITDTAYLLEPFKTLCFVAGTTKKLYQLNDLGTDWIEIPFSSAFIITEFDLATPITYLDYGHELVTPAFTAAYTLAPTSAQLLDSDGNPPIDLVDFESFATDVSYDKNPLTGTKFVTFTLLAFKGAAHFHAEVTVKWAWPLYYGAAVPEAVTEAFIHAMSGRALSPTPECTVTVDAGVDEYIYFCSPCAYGTSLQFMLGIFEGGFTQLPDIVSVSNGYGLSTEYYVWQSDVAGLGATEITVIESASSVAITDLTGDVLANGPGVTPATVVGIQGYLVYGGQPNENDLLVATAEIPPKWSHAPMDDAIHGKLSGGALHSAATQSAAGFLSAVDKIALDELIAGGGTGDATSIQGTPVDKGGSKGEVLELIDDGKGGLKWAPQVSAGGHTQNTDTGTTSSTWQLHMNDSGPLFKDLLGTLQVRTATDSDYSQIEAKLRPPAGSTAANSAPIHIPSGPLNTDPLDGAVEHYNGKLRFSMEGPPGGEVGGGWVGMTALKGDVAALGPGEATAAITSLQGQALDLTTTPPTASQVIGWDDKSKSWIPITQSADLGGKGMTSLFGDVVGAGSGAVSTEVEKLQTYPLVLNEVVDGQILGFVDIAGTITLEAVDLPTYLAPLTVPMEIPFGAGVFPVKGVGTVSVAARVINFSSYPAMYGLLNRVIKFVATLTSQGSGTAYVRLYDVTDAVAISNSPLSTPNNYPTWGETIALTVGASQGNLRTDKNALYEVQLSMIGGLSTDVVFCSYAALIISYE